MSAAMLRLGQYTFKTADSPVEFEQIHRLNHRTFAEEVRQHAPMPDGMLVDKFHAKNTYFIGVREDQVVGMVAVHSQPPYSVADRLSDPSILWAPGRRPMEVRLLAIEPQERSGNVLIALFWLCFEHARQSDFTDVYISAVSDRVDLYRRIGFEPLGPAVPCGSAMFVPMGVQLPVGPGPRKLVEHWLKRLERLTQVDEHVTE
jgi:hypothetical protein